MQNNLIFKDVGRRKFGGKYPIDIPANLNVQEAANYVGCCALEEASKHLENNGISVRYDIACNQGVIYAKKHIVGSFYLEKSLHYGK